MDWRHLRLSAILVMSISMVLHSVIRFFFLLKVVEYKYLIDSTSVQFIILELFVLHINKVLLPNVCVLKDKMLQFLVAPPGVAYRI